MSSAEHLKAFVSERLTAAAEEIFGVFKRTILEYEEEIHRHRRLLDHVLKPDVQLHRIDLPQQLVHQEEDFLPNQRLFTQERNSSLDQEDPEPPQIKEEQEEVCSSQEEEQLVLKQETDSFMLPPVDEKNDHGEAQTLDMNLNETEEESVVNVSVTSSHPATIYTSNPKTIRPHPVKCDTCGKEFQSNFNLQRHVRIHTGEKNKICKVCGKGFYDVSTLRRHTMIHTGEKPFTCKTCGTAFRYSRQLTVHMSRAHTGEKLYHCKMCGKGFHDMCIVKRHVRVHTGENPFVCETCGKCFAVSSELAFHMRLHANEKPYTCAMCGRGFRRGCQMTGHMRKAHAEELFS